MNDQFADGEKLAKEDILALVRTIGWEHWTTSYQCDLCGTHYQCVTCEDNLLGSDHVVDKIIEMLEEKL